MVPESWILDLEAEELSQNVTKQLPLRAPQ